MSGTTGYQEIDKLLERLAQLKETGHIAEICADRIIAVCDISRLRNEQIAELKRQIADNADALLVAYQQGRADGRKEDM